MLERAFLAKIGEVGKLLGHGAELPRRAFDVRPNLPEHFSRFVISPKSKQSLCTCRRVEPCTAYRQVSLDALT